MVGDPTRLGQIIMNLLSNAIKFTSSGRIELLVRLDEENPECLTSCFTVSDTGIGIDPEKQGLIFEPFRQTDGSTTRRYGGTGLGLSISRRLVEMMGGHMWLDSESGAGSRFHFTVSFGKPVPAAAPAPLVLEAGKSRTIVVEPDESRRAYLAAVLEGWNIEAAIVHSGSTALDVMRWTARVDRPFAFAIVSLAAALENGRSLLTGLERDEKLARVPLILIGDQHSPLSQSPPIETAAFLRSAVFTIQLARSHLSFSRALRTSICPNHLPLPPAAGGFWWRKICPPTRN